MNYGISNENFFARERLCDHEDTIQSRHSNFQDKYTVMHCHKTFLWVIINELWVIINELWVIIYELWDLSFVKGSQASEGIPGFLKGLGLVKGLRLVKGSQALLYFESWPSSLVVGGEMNVVETTAKE